MPEVAEMLSAEGFFMNRTLINYGSRLNSMNTSLQQILLDVTNVACLFNLIDAGSKLDPVVFQEIIISIGDRLVRFHALGDSPLGMKLEAAYHIGLIVFLTTLFIQIGRRRFLKYGLVGQCLKEVIKRGLDEDDNDLLLWLLFIGGISVLGGADQPWVVLEILKATSSMDIANWTELHKRLSRFPWINNLHNAAGEALWHTVKSMPTSTFS